MARVGHISPTHRWTSWAITRNGVETLAAELVAVVSQATNRTAKARLALDQYERPFADQEEFIENVTEDEWVQETAGWVLSVHIENSDLHVRVAVRRDDEVKLSVRGGARHERNALLPDLVDAIRRYERRGPPRGRWMAVSGIAALVVCAAIAAPFIIFQDWAFNRGVIVYMVTYVSGIVMCVRGDGRSRGSGCLSIARASRR